jgi:hypothetical protein
MTEIRKGMYWLPQAGILAYLRLVKLLNTFGYYATANTPGLLCHCSHPVTFFLVVNDFGVKQVGKAHAATTPH